MEQNIGGKTIQKEIIFLKGIAKNMTATQWEESRDRHLEIHVEFVGGDFQRNKLLNI